VLVFILSSLRKLRSLTEMLTPFIRGEMYQKRLSSFVGSHDLSSSGILAANAADLHDISSTRWYWAEKFARAAYTGTATEMYIPPAADGRSILIRKQLEGLETTLSLLDTLSDGVALFARLGVTVSLPIKFVQQATTGHSISTRKLLFHKLFKRSETLADLFWLLTTLTALGHAEWERREVWSFGRRVRRLMRDEELERDQVERERERQGKEISPDMAEDELEALLQDDEHRAQRMKSQRRTLRDLRGRLSWLYWERWRLGADAVFAAYDLFEWRRGSEGVRATAGLISAAVGFSQVGPTTIICSRNRNAESYATDMGRKRSSSSLN
jgi:hypothetical protein